MKPINDHEIQRLMEQFELDQLPESLSHEQQQEAKQYKMLFDALEEEPPYQLSADFTDKVMQKAAAYDQRKAWKEYLGLASIIVLAVAGSFTALYYTDLLNFKEFMAPANKVVSVFDKYKFIIAFISVVGILSHFAERLVGNNKKSGQFSMK
jgi:hypothetical protein